MSYMKHEDVPEDEEIFNFRFRHIKTDKTNKYKLIGCESDKLYDNDKLFNFWSNQVLNEEISVCYKKSDANKNMCLCTVDNMSLKIKIISLTYSF